MSDKKTKKEERTWVEEIEITGSELVDRVKELIAEGNVRLFQRSRACDELSRIAFRLVYSRKSTALNSRCSNWQCDDDLYSSVSSVGRNGSAACTSEGSDCPYKGAITWMKIKNMREQKRGSRT